MMKKLLKYTLIFSLFSLLFSCESETSFLEDLETLGFQGTEEDIIDFLSADAYQALVSMGVNINKGGTPPEITGSYWVSPNVLTATNVESDYEPGEVFSDKLLVFSSQDNEQLSISYEAGQFNDDGEQINYESSTNSFISGSGNDFTIIVRVVSEQYGSSGLVNMTQGVIISGTKTEGGVRDLQHSLILIEKTGDTDNEFISTGKGRIFRDGDNFSEKY